jgi:hypothetical protein
MTRLTLTNGTFATNAEGKRESKTVFTIVILVKMMCAMLAPRYLIRKMHRVL